MFEKCVEKKFFYKYFIFQIHQIIHIIFISFRELYKITTLCSYFSSL